MLASEKHNYCRKPNKTNPRSVGAVLLSTANAVKIKNTIDSLRRGEIVIVWIFYNIVPTELFFIVSIWL